jgi:hypothetical protein
VDHKCNGISTEDSGTSVHRYFWLSTDDIAAQQRPI